MESGYGGAKPKTKFLRRSDESSEPNGHVCSKEKHKQKKSIDKFGKNKSDSNINNSFINEGIDSVDNIDYLTHDTDGLFDDSGISNCNDSVLLNDSGNAMRERYINHGESENAVTERKKRHGYDTLRTLPPFMPKSNLSESDLFADIDFKRNDDNDEYVNEMEEFWKDVYEEKDKNKSGHKNNTKIEKNRKINKLKSGMPKAENGAEKTLENKKNEVVKRHEDTLREKCKRSGLALRRFLSERLGFNSNVKREKLNKQNSKLSGENHKLAVKLENTKSKCDEDMHNECQHKHTCTCSSHRSQFEPENKHMKKDKKHKPDKATRKDSLSSETSSDKGSRSMISRFKMSIRSKKKKTDNEFAMLSDESYPSSPMSHSSSSNGSSSRLSHDHLARLSCDQSHDRDIVMYDSRDWINDNDLIITLNMGGGNDKHLCDCRMCQGQNFSRSLKDGKKHDKQQSSSKVQKTKDKKEKSKKFFRKGKSKKTEYIGVLDHELSSLDGGK